MTASSESIQGAAPTPLDVVLDGAILGVSRVYPSQRAGIWRFLREWMRELASRPEVRLHLVSSGRAPWNELALEEALSSDPFLRDLPMRWSPRKGPVPAWRTLQSRLARFAFRHLGTRCSPTAMAGILRALQPGLASPPPSVSPGIHHSPYHALPETAPPGQVRSITIHDMIPTLFPQWFDDTLPFRRAVGSIGPRDHVFADSHSTRRDVLAQLGLPDDHVHVAHPGISDGFRPRDRAACRGELARLGIPPVRFLLAVGTLEPRKNLPALLQAFARTVSDDPSLADLHLVLTGARGWRNEEFDRVLSGLGPLRERVLATGFLAEDDLPILYGACEAFVFPSLYEGFGLPIAEAQASGAAVVCVDNSSQREVAGEAALIAPDATPEALATILREGLATPDTLGTLRRLGPPNAARFRWSACLDIHLEVWREALARNGGDAR